MATWGDGGGTPLAERRARQPARCSPLPPLHGPGAAAAAPVVVVVAPPGCRRQQRGCGHELKLWAVAATAAPSARGPGGCWCTQACAAAAAAAAASAPAQRAQVHTLLPAAPPAGLPGRAHHIAGVELAWRAQPSWLQRLRPALLLPPRAPAPPPRPVPHWARAAPPAQLPGQPAGWAALAPAPLPQLPAGASPACKRPQPPNLAHTTKATRT